MHWQLFVLAPINDVYGTCMGRDARGAEKDARAPPASAFGELPPKRTRCGRLAWHTYAGWHLPRPRMGTLKGAQVARQWVRAPLMCGC